MKRRAFTLVEVIVTVVIVGIVAAMALPMFSRAMETTKAKEAKAALQQIRTGERIYRYETNTYFYSTLALGDKEKIEELNTKLRLYLDARDNRNWDYKVEVGETPESTFDATATRKGGKNDGESIVIDETGAIDESGWSP